MTGPRDKMVKRLKRMRDERFFDEVNSVLYVGADMVRSEAHQLISRGSVSGKNHIPSAPGEPPNRDSGHLQAHLEASQPRPLTARVTASAEYSAALEWGTSKMAERPFLRPARDAMAPKVKRLLNSKLARITRARKGL